MSLTQYSFLDAYNPWWGDGEAAFASLLEFHHDVFCRWRTLSINPLRPKPVVAQMARLTPSEYTFRKI